MRNNGFVMVQAIGVVVGLTIMLPILLLLLGRFLDFGFRVQHQLNAIQEQIYVDRISREDLTLKNVNFVLKAGRVQRVQSSPQWFRNVTQQWKILQVSDSVSASLRTLSIRDSSRVFDFISVVP